MSSASSALSQLKRYQPSGAMPIFGTAAALAVSVCAGAVLGAVYAFVNHHDPLIYLNVLLAIGLSWLLGWIASKGVRVFRIRNGAAAIAIGAAAFLSAYLIHWPVYVATVLADYGEIGNSSYDLETIARFSVTLIQEPGALWDAIRIFNEGGVWSLSGGSPGSSGMEVKGILLTLIWIAEVLTIAWYAITGPLAAAMEPYSERQEKWLEPKELPGHIAFIEKEKQEEFYNALLRGDYSALSTPLPVSEESERKYASVVLYIDAFEPYVTVANVSSAGAKKTSEGLGKKLFRWFIYDSTKGKGGVSTSCVVLYLKISPTVAQNIMSALYVSSKPID